MLFPVVSEALLGWETRAHALSNLVVGASCVAGVAGLVYLYRQSTESPARRAYLPGVVVLIVTAIAHIGCALSLFPPRVWFDVALALSRAICGVGAVALLGHAVARVSSLVDRDREAHRRESDLSAILDERSAAYAKLQELAQLKTQVFANVSHELRTPLTLILGPLQALRESNELTGEARAALAIVDRNAQLLLGHVNDLLELSRADAVGVTLSKEPTDVGALLDSLAESFRPLARELGVEYEVQLRAPFARLLLDPEKVERIAMNLLANAFKFTPHGGKVRLALDMTESLENPLRASELRLSVDDSGPGIPTEHRDLVFERFRQLDGKPNRQFSGTGLGLSIVREFVVACAGSVHVEDSVLGGARLVVRLPAEPSDVPQDREPESRPPSLSSAEMLALRPRPASGADLEQASDVPLILVVEDNADMNRFVCSSLASEFRVASAHDGPQALARLDHLTPDLIVTDFMMPHMSGDEFVQALRRRPNQQDIPVLVLTARDDVQLRVRALSDGVQDWLSKPFTVPELVARARNLVSARRARIILQAELTTRGSDVGQLAEQLAQRKRQLESLLESLSQALEHAEVASRFKTSLLRLVSHELRTPLGALQLQLERLSGERPGPLNTAQQELIVRMGRSLARLTDTIQSLLEYARIESGRLEMSVEKFDIVELSRGVVDDFAPQAESKGIALRLHTTEVRAEFESDARLVRLVLVNLVANALKFTERGQVTVQLGVSFDGCQLIVQDTGPGIEQSLHISVFEPFFRGESASNRQFSQGVGLGLSLVREMLHALGGNIELQSALGAGSRFRVSIPRARRSETVAIGMASPDSSRGSSRA